MISELADNLFNYNNRCNRVEFVWYQALSVLVFVGLVSTVSVIYHWMKLIVPDNPAIAMVPALVLFIGFIAYIYSNVCIVIKRLHDMDLSGLHVWWIVLLNICISDLLDSYLIAVGLFYTLLALCYIALALIPGTKGSNRYDDEDTTDQ